MGKTTKDVAVYSPVQSLIDAADSLPFAFLVVKAPGSGQEKGQAGAIIAFNKRFCELCECDSREALLKFAGGNYENLINDKDLLVLRANIANMKDHHSYFRLRTSRGNEIHVEDVETLVEDPLYGQVVILYMTGFGEDRNQNIFDLVTGMYQKEYLWHWLREQTEFNPEMFQDRRLAVVYLNCRDFRIFNDTYGFEAGNRYLKKLGEQIEEDLCTTMVARIYADQFVVYCDAARVEAGVKSLHEWALQQTDLKLWLYAGVCYPESEDIAKESVMDCAKIACDQIKTDGSRYLNVYTSELAKSIEKREYIQTHIDEAAEKGWLVLYLQPVVRTLSGKVCSAEGLARWVDPQYGMISPGEFVPALEEKNLSYKLALFVIDKAAELIADAQKENRPVFPVSINFSRKDFDAINPFEEVEKAVLRHGIQRRYLCIEITESMAMENPQRIQEIIGHFHKAGYEVWMDDFGSAYSSLNTLKDFDFDEIKLDMIFMRGLNEKAREIVTSCINMAKHLGIHTLCEGVETEEQLSFLRDVGCEKIQGFYYSKPRPPKELLEFMDETGLCIENVAEHNLYDAIGNLMFDTQTEWMLTMELGGIDHVLYFSPKLREDAPKLGLDDGLVFNGPDMGAGSVHFAERIGTVIREAEESGSEEELSYFQNGHYYALTSKVIARFNDSSISHTQIRDTTEESRQLLLANADPVTQSLANICDAIYGIDLKTMKFEVIASVFPGEKAGMISAYSTKAATRFFYWKDQDRFIRWAREAKKRLTGTEESVENIAEDDNGLQKSYREGNDTIHGRRYSTGVFRIMHHNGTYSWTALTVVPYIGDPDRFLVCVRPPAYTDEENTLVYDGETMADDDVIPDEAAGAQKTDRDDSIASGSQMPVSGTDLCVSPDVSCSSGNIRKSEGTRIWSGSTLWRAFTDQSVLKLFWKDRNRRFIGVSQAFLRYYGFHSMEEVLGKTDEEIGWHVDDGEFREIEEDILRSGRTVQHAETTIILSGRTRIIQATKFPIEYGGEIVGLMGFFEDVTESANGTGSEDLDRSTGFMHFSSWITAVSGLENGYQAEHEDYLLAVVSLKNFWSVRKEYGKEPAEMLAVTAADALRAEFGGNVLYARLDLGTLVIAIRQGPEGEKSADAKAQDARAGFEAVNNLLQQEIWAGSYHGRVFLSYGTAYRSECESLFQTVTRAAADSES